MKNKHLTEYLRNSGNDLATVRFSAFCGAMLSNNSFNGKDIIFYWNIHFLLQIFDKKVSNVRLLETLIHYYWITVYSNDDKQYLIYQPLFLRYHHQIHENPLSKRQCSISHRWKDISHLHLPRLSVRHQ